MCPPVVPAGGCAPSRVVSIFFVHTVALAFYLCPAERFSVGSIVRVAGPFFVVLGSAAIALRGRRCIRVLVVNGMRRGLGTRRITFKGRQVRWHVLVVSVTSCFFLPRTYNMYIPCIRSCLVVGVVDPSQHARFLLSQTFFVRRHRSRVGDILCVCVRTEYGRLFCL